MERLGTVLQPDLRAVTCLAFSSVPSSSELGAHEAPCWRSGLPIVPRQHRGRMEGEGCLAVRQNVNSLKRHVRY
jgi:hypothetical protein